MDLLLTSEFFSSFKLRKNSSILITIICAFVLVYLLYVTAITTRYLRGFYTNVTFSDMHQDFMNIRSKVYNYKNKSWENAHNLTLFCYLNGTDFVDFNNIFLLSFNLFWPVNSWKKSNLGIITDGENKANNKFGTIQANLPPFPDIKIQKSISGLNNCKTEESRINYLYFTLDLYTKAPYIAIVNHDTFFVTRVTPDDLFVRGKPRVYGYNGCCNTKEDSKVNEEVIGYHSVGDFSNTIGMPFVINRDHLLKIRNRIKQKMKSSSFEEAFDNICLKYKESWHIRNTVASKSNLYSKLMTDKKEVLESNKPIVGLMKHKSFLKNNTSLAESLYDYICLASEENCANIKKDSLLKAKKSLFANKQMYDLEETENPWSSEYLSWEQAYEDHEENVRQRNFNSSSWNWKKFILND